MNADDEFVIPVRGDWFGRPDQAAVGAGHLIEHRLSADMRRQGMDLYVLGRYPAAVDEQDYLTLVLVEDRSEYVEPLRQVVDLVMSQLPYPSGLIYPFELLWLLPPRALAQSDNKQAVLRVQEAIETLDARAILLDLSWHTEEENYHDLYLEHLVKSVRHEAEIATELDSATSGLRLLRNFQQTPRSHRRYGVVVYSKRTGPTFLLVAQRLGADAVVHKGGRSIGEQHGIEILERLLAAIPGRYTALPLWGANPQGGWLVTQQTASAWDRALRSLPQRPVLLSGPIGAGRRSLVDAVLRHLSKDAQAWAYQLDLMRPVEDLADRAWLKNQVWKFKSWEEITRRTPNMSAPAGLRVHIDGPWLNPKYPGWAELRELMETELAQPVPIAFLLPARGEEPTQWDLLARLQDAVSVWGQEVRVIDLPGLKQRAYIDDIERGYPPREEELWPLARYLFWRDIAPPGRPMGLISAAISRLWDLDRNKDRLLYSVWLNHSWPGNVLELSAFMSLLARDWSGSAEELENLWTHNQRTWSQRLPTPRRSEPPERRLHEAAREAVYIGQPALPLLRYLWRSLDEMCGDKDCIASLLRARPDIWDSVGRLLAAPGQPPTPGDIARTLSAEVADRGWEDVQGEIEAAVLVHALEIAAGNQTNAFKQLGLSGGKWRTAYPRALRQISASINRNGPATTAEYYRISEQFLDGLFNDPNDG